MRNKIFIPAILWGAVALFIATWVFCAQPQSNEKSKLTVQPIDDKGIFVGEANKGRVDFNSYDHQKAIKAIDDASNFESAGNVHYRNGDFEKASGEYKKAYLIRGGLSQATSGLKLAMTYEKLHRYDEGIALLDEMIVKGYLSEKGIQNANEIKSRLLSAKSAYAKRS